ncbi:uncharacterized protein LOC110729024 isoform X1 [Chenopodium quinoa]|uniref:uncharacterized protein LOC110729024 isoform X1 n=1 Tax=Chenopodium quinoa TaxID=63459 RepID=UPI000B77B88E|nr:uncharacterized protein LOC110729024 isoform X1 [Chenopodium quinoa]
MEENRMHSCSEGKEVILAEFMHGGWQSEFYVMDLKAEKIRKTPIATLLNEIGLGSAVRLGPLIYNFGGDTKADYDFFRGSDHHIHLGASALFLTKSHALSLLNQCDDEDECDPSGSKSESIRWMSAPVMKHRRMALSCASLGVKYMLWEVQRQSCVSARSLLLMLGSGSPCPNHLLIFLWSVSASLLL